jgi:NAD(P)-dependent dehydrogenase (short-subunit alcohol dehydrogenase family)
LLRAEGTKAQAVLLDVANPSSIAAARDTVEQHFPRLDALVNNAAIYYDT